MALATFGRGTFLDMEQGSLATKGTLKKSSDVSKVWYRREASFRRATMVIARQEGFCVVCGWLGGGDVETYYWRWVEEQGI